MKPTKTEPEGTVDVEKPARSVVRDADTGCGVAGGSVDIASTSAAGLAIGDPVQKVLDEFGEPCNRGDSSGLQYRPQGGVVSWTDYQTLIVKIDTNDRVNELTVFGSGWRFPDGRRLEKDIRVADVEDIVGRRLRRTDGDSEVEMSDQIAQFEHRNYSACISPRS